MHKLDLTPAAFEILYEAMVLNSDGYRGQELRIGNKILDKLEAVGVVAEGTDGDRGLWKLNPIYNHAEIELENQEFDLLKKAFNSVSWSGKGIRKITPVLDLLENSKPG